MANDKPKSPKDQGKKETPIRDLPAKNLQPDANGNVKGGIRPMYGAPADKDL